MVSNATQTTSAQSEILARAACAKIFQQNIFEETQGTARNTSAIKRSPPTQTSATWLKFSSTPSSYRVRVFNEGES
jgi:hypothetical protein